MTRVNVGYPVKELTRQHLIAEHREIKRIPNMVAAGRVDLDNIPTTFCLGTGHVRFFYDKLGYLLTRYREIYDECILRGYRVQNYSSAWNDIPVTLYEGLVARFKRHRDC
jgi:deoxyribonuclease (pyrimidine dimer)